MDNTTKRSHVPSHSRTDISLLEKRVVTCSMRFGMIMLSFGIMVLIASQLITKNFPKGQFTIKCPDKSISIFCYDHISYHFVEIPFHHSAEIPSHHSVEIPIKERHYRHLGTTWPHDNQQRNTQRNYHADQAQNYDIDGMHNGVSREGTRLETVLPEIPLPNAGYFKDITAGSIQTVNPFCWFIGSCISLVLFYFVLFHAPSIIFGFVIFLSRNIALFFIYNTGFNGIFDDKLSNLCFICFVLLLMIIQLVYYLWY